MLANADAIASIPLCLVKRGVRRPHAPVCFLMSVR